MVVKPQTKDDVGGRWVKKRGRTTGSGKNQELAFRTARIVASEPTARLTICARNASCLLGAPIVLNLWGLIRSLYTSYIHESVTDNVSYRTYR